jgi:hypothetical protein
MLTSSSSLVGALHESRKVEVGVSSLPYHDDVQGAPQQTLAGGYSLWVGGGQKPAEYKGVAQFVSFLMEPDLQVEFSAVAGFPADDRGGACCRGQQAVEGRRRRPQCRLRQLQGPALCARCACRRSSGCGSSSKRNWKPPGPARRRPSRRSTTPSSAAISSLPAAPKTKAAKTGAAARRSDRSAPRLALAARLRAPLRGCAGAGEHAGRSAYRRPAGRAGGRVRRDAVGRRFAVAAARRNAASARPTAWAGCARPRCRTVRPRRRCFASTRRLPASRADAGVGGARLPATGLLANVEIKPAAGFDTLTGEVVARRCVTCGRRGIAAGFVVFGSGAGGSARRRCPNLPLGMLYERVPADWLACLGSRRRCTLHCDADRVNDAICSARASQRHPGALLHGQ